MGRNGRTFVKGKPKTGGRRKGSLNKVPGSFKASVRRVFSELNDQEYDDFRASLLKGLKAKPPFSAPYFRLAAEYIDGKPKGEGDGPPPGSFFQIILGQGPMKDPLAYRYEGEKALRVPEEPQMVVVPEEPQDGHGACQDGQDGKPRRRRAGSR